MQPPSPLRPSVSLASGQGRLHCVCGRTVVTTRLNAPITCPQCGRGWQLKAEIRLASSTPKRTLPLPPK